MTSVLVGVATFNERQNLPNLVEELRRTVPSADILVVDDDSPDGTGKWCDEYARKHDRFHVLHGPRQSGLGSATIRIFQFAVDRDYVRLVTLDADHSHAPSAIPRLLEQLVPDVDVVIGSRYVPGGQIVGWPLRRRVISRLVNATARWGLGIPVHDSSGAFRCYRVERLRQLPLTDLQSRGYSIYEEVLMVLYRTGAKFRESPIVFTDRTRGSTKAGWSEMLSSGWHLLRLLAQRCLGR